MERSKKAPAARACAALGCVAIALLALTGCQPAQETPAEPEGPAKPNVLLIMADDLGFSDLGCYGGEIETPVLDQLASGGMRFTNFYNGARCCPTRASLLTGLSPHRVGMGSMVKMQPAEQPHPYQGYLAKASATLAEVAATAGYRNYMVGKWHVGEFRPHFPVDRGFDRYYGLISGAMNYWNIEKTKRANLDRKFAEDTTLIDDASQEGFYSTYAYTEKALEYLDDHFADHSDKPFFFYLAHQAPHWPLHAPDSVIAKFRGRYMAGWDAMRAGRIARQKEMGLLADDVELSPRDPWAADWDTLTVEEQDHMDLLMATHAAMVHIMDQQIGRVLDRIEQAGQLDNTVVLFLSDNGASAEGGNLGDNMRPDLGGPVGSEDSYFRFGSSWANASNAPYRKYKRTTFEGGFLTPLVVHWGDQVAQPGGYSASLGHIVDVMPTLVELTGGTYPEARNGQPVPAMEGKSLVPILTGAAATHRTEADPLIWEHEGCMAVRQGPWKLVKFVNEEDWKLYNLDNDRTELNNLAEAMPERVADMKALYDAWAQEVGVDGEWPPLTSPS